MSSDGPGRFCGSCQKNVFDFTRRSDRDIARALATSGPICGRFYASQLERRLVHTEPKPNRFSVIAAIAVTLFSTGNAAVSAQEKQQTEQHPLQAKLNLVNDTIDNGHVSGIVMDGDEPLPGVSLVILNTNVGTTTDFEGRFTIAASANDKLVISYLGYNDQVITVASPQQNISIQLAGADNILMGEVVYHHTFFGRLFRKIARIF